MKISTSNSYEGGSFEEIPHAEIETTTSLNTILVNRRNAYILEYPQQKHMSHLVYISPDKQQYHLLPADLEESAMNRLIDLSVPVAVKRPGLEDFEWYQAAVEVYDEEFMEEANIMFAPPPPMFEQMQVRAKYEKVFGIAKDIGAIGAGLVAMVMLKNFEHRLQR